MSINPEIPGGDDPCIVSKRLSDQFDQIFDPKKEEEWLSTPDACRVLGISVRTMFTYRSKGIVPFYRLGGKIIFRLSDLRAALKKSNN
jgi:excisionase family DNA binding protein